MSLIKKTISQLTKKATLAMTDLLPIAGSGSSELKSTTLQDIMDLLNYAAMSDEMKAAVQAYVEENGVAVPEVVDNLTSTSTTAALSAAQGGVLERMIPDVVDNLNDTSTTAALSAAQGKKLNDEKVSTSALKGKVLDMFYPVGTIYQTTSSSFNPAASWGGTWTRITDRFLLGAGGSYSGGSTGGEQTHSLTPNEGPSHAHVMYASNGNASSTWTPDAGSYLVGAGSISETKNTYWAQLGMGNAGAGAAHNNMPPYVAVYIWKRTA